MQVGRRSHAAATDRRDDVRGQAGLRPQLSAGLAQTAQRICAARDAADQPAVAIRQRPAAQGEDHAGLDQRGLADPRWAGDGDCRRAALDALQDGLELFLAAKVQASVGFAEGLRADIRTATIERTRLADGLMARDERRSLLRCVAISGRYGLLWHTST
jgi:hypothetical protein